jgi:hypothetical protein
MDAYGQGDIYRQVLEDGNDVCDSESDSENEEHGDELTGCYMGIPSVCLLSSSPVGVVPPPRRTYMGIPVNEHGDPIGAEHKLTEEQTAVLRWQG